MFQPLAQNSYELQEDAVFCVILFLHLTSTTDVSCRWVCCHKKTSLHPRLGWVGETESAHPPQWVKEEVSDMKTHCVYSIQLRCVYLPVRTWVVQLMIQEQLK